MIKSLNQAKEAGRRDALQGSLAGLKKKIEESFKDIVMGKFAREKVLTARTKLIKRVDEMS